MAFTPKHPLVWCEIPVSDMDKAMSFYSAVFGYDLKIDDSGPNPMAFLPAEDFESGIAGHIYPGKPAAKGTGNTVHLAVPDTVESAQDRVRKAGGEAGGPVIDIPAGRFGYATDPDGNSIGLFQAAG